MIFSLGETLENLCYVCDCMGGGLNVRLGERIALEAKWSRERKFFYHAF